MKALVLSGGGSKGSYQIGVWKALRKLHIKPEIVTGTSIGAVNGIMIVQKQFHKAQRLWENLNFEQLFNVDLENETDKKEVYLTYIKEFIKNKGMSTDKIENFINEAINTKKFYNSKINYGLVTFNLSELKPNELLKKDIKPEKLKEYVLASATCFPAFKIKNINDEQFIDGGYYDNLPINLAIDMDAKEIIAVDLNEIGLKQKVKDKSIKIKYISPKNDLGSFLIFDSNQAKKNIKYGYNDTLKVYNKLDGNKYTFKYNHLYKNYKKISWEFNNLLKELFENNEDNKNIYDNFIKYSQFNKLLKKEIEDRITINETIEFLGDIYNLDDTKIYHIREFNRLILKNNKEYKVRKISIKNIKSDDFEGIINSKLLVKYIYNHLIEKSYTYEVRKDLCRLASLFPKEFLGAMYIMLINHDYYFI